MTIIDLAADLGLAVVAQGVEDHIANGSSVVVPARRTALRVAS